MFYNYFTSMNTEEDKYQRNYWKSLREKESKLLHKMSEDSECFTDTVNYLTWCNKNDERSAL